MFFLHNVANNRASTACMVSKRLCVGCREPPCSTKTSLVWSTLPTAPHNCPEPLHVVIAGINDDLGSLHDVASHSDTLDTKTAAAQRPTRCNCPTEVFRPMQQAKSPASLFMEDSPL